jgi:hypothetical protein
MVGHVAEVFIGNVFEGFNDQLLLRSHLKTGEGQIPKVGRYRCRNYGLEVGTLCKVMEQENWPLFSCVQIVLTPR